MLVHKRVTDEAEACKKIRVSGLTIGENILMWSVKAGVCPAIGDTVKVIVQNLKIQL